MRHPAGKSFLQLGFSRSSREGLGRGTSTILLTPSQPAWQTRGCSTSHPLPQLNPGRTNLSLYSKILLSSPKLTALSFLPDWAAPKGPQVSVGFLGSPEFVQSREKFLFGDAWWLGKGWEHLWNSQPADAGQVVGSQCLLGSQKVLNIVLVEIKELNPRGVQWKRKVANAEFNILYISIEILMGRNQNLAVNTFRCWNLVSKDSNYSKKKTLGFQFHILAFGQMDIPQSVNRPKNWKVIPVKFLHCLRTLTHLWTINGININT